MQIIRSQFFSHDHHQLYTDVYTDLSQGCHWRAVSFQHNNTGGAQPVIPTQNNPVLASVEDSPWEEVTHQFVF